MFKINVLTQKIICFCLAITLALSLMGCNAKDNKDKNNSSSSVSSDESYVNSDSEENVEDEEAEDDSYDEEDSDEEDLDEEETADDFWSDDEEDFDEDVSSEENSSENEQETSSDKNTSSENNSSKENSSVEDSDNDEEDETESDDFEEDSEEDETESEDFEEEWEEDFSDEEEVGDDESEDEEIEEEFGSDWVFQLNAFNGSAPIIDTYRGMSATVYHAFGFMKDDKSGRAYTDEMLDLEIDRLQKMGVKTCRTKAHSPWFWSESTNNWNLDSVRANYFYEYCKELQSRDMNIVMQLGWDVEFVIEIIKGGKDAQQEAKYLDGRGDDLNGESANYDLSGLDEYWTRVTKAGLRFGYLYKNLINELKKRGIHNVDYLMFFTEPCNRNPDGSYHPNGPSDSAEPYLKLCRIIKDYLVKADVLDGIQTMGGAQGGSSDALLRYVLQNDPDVFEIHACHTYPTAQYIIDNVYYDSSEPYFRNVMGAMHEYGVFETKEFWCDEFSARDAAANQKRNQPDEDPWYGLQGVVGALCAQSFGVSNIISWQAADQLWTDQTNDGLEFIDGIHMCGAMPSLFNSDVPRGEYYMWGLFSKYNGYQNGKVYKTDYVKEYWISGLHLGVLEHEDGNWTITVVNADGLEDRTFQLNLERAIGKTLYRHTENVYTCVRNTGAVIADVDKVFVDVKDKLKDTLPAGTLAIYTTIKD